MLNVDSKVLSNTGADEANYVYKYNLSRKDRIYDFFKRRIEQRLKNWSGINSSMIFSTGLLGYDITTSPLYKDADIVNLHWILGFCSLGVLRKIRKPVVWTLRDMWPMTGGCHHLVECEKYKTGCGACKLIGKAADRDISSFIVGRKEKILTNHKFHYIGISKWVTNTAKASYLLKDASLVTILNNIDLNEYYPVDKRTARQALGLDTDKMIIAFGAQSVCDVFKGGDLFLDALQCLDPEKYFLVIFGRNGHEFLRKVEFEYKYFGFITDTLSLRLIYSASDVFVAPSRVEAFGKTIAEAMACKTPAVCFDTSGQREIVDHKVNGFKAVPFKPGSLAEGIDWIVNSSNYPELCEMALKKIEDNFSNTVIAGKYLELYTRIMNQ